MKENSLDDFGFVIAYLLPGLVALWGCGYFEPTIRSWFGAVPENAPTIGGFLYVTLASLAAGLVASTVRWMLIDTLFHRTGIPRPHWNFSRLQANVAAFDFLVGIHYRYYQFYANGAVAVVFTSVARHLAAGQRAHGLDMLDLAAVVLIAVLLAGARDTFRKYCTRVGQVLTTSAPQ